VTVPCSDSFGRRPGLFIVRMPARAAFVLERVEDPASLSLGIDHFSPANAVLGSLPNALRLGLWLASVHISSRISQSVTRS
jgi:hypothetical protein